MLHGYGEFPVPRVKESGILHDGWKLGHRGVYKKQIPMLGRRRPAGPLFRAPGEIKSPRALISGARPHLRPTAAFRGTKPARAERRLSTLLGHSGFTPGAALHAPPEMGHVLAVGGIFDFPGDLNLAVFCRHDNAPAASEAS